MITLASQPPRGIHEYLDGCRALAGCRNLALVVELRKVEKDVIMLNEIGRDLKQMTYEAGQP